MADSILSTIDNNGAAHPAASLTEDTPEDTDIPRLEPLKSIQKTTQVTKSLTRIDNTEHNSSHNLSSTQTCEDNSNRSNVNEVLQQVQEHARLYYIILY